MVMQQIRKEFEEYITDKSFLRSLGLSRKDLLKLLHREESVHMFRKIMDKPHFLCADVLEYCRPVMDQLAPEPADGWLNALFLDGKHVLFPENFEAVLHPVHFTAKNYYMRTLHFCIGAEARIHGFEPTWHLQLADEAEQGKSHIREEYGRFLNFMDTSYFPEFMRIAAEITPFNTRGHILGVHHVAMVMARQLKAAGAPVDLALMSAAAISHDIGKFGCKDKEARRVPYLHYYYTDLCMKRNEMPVISYIAANHSTWDLELENLSMESLLLIYADFRVKSTRVEGEEIIHFYGLDDSFQVILDKLDNVDDAKRKRYVYVYNKLADFEKYMVRLGCTTYIPDPGEENPDPRGEERENERVRSQVRCLEKDPVLLIGSEVVEAFKNSAVRHNVSLMHAINNEATFTGLLESARSEKEGKNIRTYLNLVREYCTYMNQKQKQITLQFLYELLMHHESDIRNEAALLMGRLVAGFDIEYRKELPEGKTLAIQEITGVELFRQYVDRMLCPDPRLTEQHKKWLSYKLETFCRSLLTEVKESRRVEFLRVFTDAFLRTDYENFIAFCMIHSLRLLPGSFYGEEELAIYLKFCLVYMGRGNVELDTAILDYTWQLLCSERSEDLVVDYAHRFLQRMAEEDVLSTQYLRHLIETRLQGAEEWDEARIQRSISRAFLDNLKSATSWICKVVNIQFLMDHVRKGTNKRPINTVTHLANLMTSADCIDVRERASEAVMEMTGYLPSESYMEVAVELLQIMELGTTECAQTLPVTLARLILKMKPREVEEFLDTLEQVLITESDSAACLALDAIGVMLQKMPEYIENHPADGPRQRDRLLGMLMRGMCVDRKDMRREAVFVLGEVVFSDHGLSLEDKYHYFRVIARKVYHILTEGKEEDMDFMINSASLNHLYRFISRYILEYGSLQIPSTEKVVFFPGTFDPFSLSHKGIVEEMRRRGYEVYLSIDEFSWSKKTQPRLIRRKIALMSTADDPGVFLFPDKLSINIANPKDLRILRNMFLGRSVYIAAGSDVVKNASAYKKPVEENSIHTFHHILFTRNMDTREAAEDDSARVILGQVEHLTLKPYMERISSTLIRENVDLNRDISNLIDPMVQRYIYENNLYLREPAYKPLLMQHPICSQLLTEMTPEVWDQVKRALLKEKHADTILDRLRREKLNVTLLRDEQTGCIKAMALHRIIRSRELHHVFESLEVCRRIRSRVRGDLLLMEAIYANEESRFYDYYQMLLTEILSRNVNEDVGYCIWYGRKSMGERRPQVVDTLRRQGFVTLEPEQPEGQNEPFSTWIPETEEMIMIVSMHKPYVITGNMDTVIKAPFQDNERVRAATAEAHRRLQRAIAAFEPGHLTLSFDASVMHYQMTRIITEQNNVPNEETVPRKLGEKMCVPFGKMLRSTIIPNTVTKALHTEKVYEQDMSKFEVEEYPGYSPLKTQIRMIQSFDREVILVDDILHSGERLRKLHRYLEDSEVKVSHIVTGIMTGNGMDQIMGYGIPASCVYFIPDLRAWFVESTLYPFIGGDSMRSRDRKEAGMLRSINMILPYSAPYFMMQFDTEKVYRMSMVCLENARDLLLVLEKEYREEFGKTLTIDRLGEVILSPTFPDEGQNMTFNHSLPASYYVMNDIRRLQRLRGMQLRK